jgi:RNA polymerase sigma-70 factor (ECF subfamily)
MNSRWIEVARLVERAQAGDRDAFGELASRFRSSVYATVLSRQRDAHDADEIVQEVFIHAMKKIRQLREPACFGAWLQRIAVRAVLNRAARRRALTMVPAETLDQAASRAATPLDDLLRKERTEMVRRAVAGLKPIDRTALASFYLAGKSVAQIAAELGIPIGTVKRRLHTARHRLQAALVDFGEPVRNGVGAETPRRAGALAVGQL